jgi:mannose-6-phosphate isomerase-like protein (cupin superfamily)
MRSEGVSWLPRAEYRGRGGERKPVTAEPWMFSLQDALAPLADGPDGVRFHAPLEHGTMKIGVYAPLGHDPQGPHERDEIYIIIAGSGEFVKNGEVRRFAPQDVIFVEAGVRHFR